MSEKAARQRRALNQAKKLAEDTRRQAVAAVRGREEMERKAIRAQLPIPARISKALIAARMLGSSSAAPLEGKVSSGKAGSKAPPSADQWLGGRGTVSDVYERRFRLLVQSLEREVDSHIRRPVEADRVTESAEERNGRLYRDFEGLPPEEVLFCDPTFKSSAAIERARVKGGRWPSDGKVRVRDD